MDEKRDEVLSAPIFHQDRSHYTDGLASCSADADPARTDVRVSEIEIPVATGFSNETAFFTARWEERRQRHEERFVARIEPATGPLFPARLRAGRGPRLGGMRPRPHRGRCRWWLMFDRMSFDDLGADRMEGFPTRDEMISLYAAATGREVWEPHYWEVFATMRYCTTVWPRRVNGRP